MKYYTYAYLRKDKTPYYVGKGTGRRCFAPHRVSPPKDKSRILILKYFDNEADAFKHERYMIAVLGRKDLGTGLLHNLTDGGEGNCGRKQPQSFCDKQSQRLSGVPKTTTHKRKLSVSNMGKKRSDTTKQRLSASKKGKPWSEKRRAAYEARWDTK